jgi:spore maturation protein CgeB
MDAKTYISNIVNETINQIKEDKFRESIRPMIAEAVMEEKSGKIKVGALVQKLMDNPEFKQKAIDYLNNDSERERIIANAYKKVSKNHSWERRVEDLDNIINEVLGLDD